MQSYGQKAQRRAVKEAVREEMHRYAEHFDLCVLMTLRRYGYGANSTRILPPPTKISSGDTTIATTRGSSARGVTPTK